MRLSPLILVAPHNSAAQHEEHIMQRNDDFHEDSVIDLGLATSETKGAMQGQADSDGQPRNLFGGLTDD